MKFSEMKYERIDYAKVGEEIKALTQAMRDAKTFEEAFAVHEKSSKLSHEVSSMIQICMIRHDIDTTDEFYDKEQEYNDEFAPTIREAQVGYTKALYESPFKAQFMEKIGPVAFKNMELELEYFVPEMVPLMQEENALVTRYEKLVATAKIEWEGETLNLPLMTKYTTSPDRETRKKAFAKTTGFFMDNRAEFDEIYDKLVKCRTAQAKLLGFDTYTKLGYARMQRNDYGPDQVKAFRDEVKKKIVPLATKAHEARRKRIGVDHLYYYDTTFFVNGNPEPIGTPEEILASGKKMYEELSPLTGEFFNYMLDNERFDVLGRKTKRNGGYMTSIPNDDNTPFVFANFNKTAGDVDVITHECGHAFQGYLTRKDCDEYRNITMETAEIHSMSMEFFAEPWMEQFFGDRADDYRSYHLEDSLTFIPYGCMVDEFQHIVYANPDMTPEERRMKWVELEKEYRPHMDYGDNECYLTGGLWQRQSHIYAMPFYYIDYCLAQTVALEYKAWMDTDYKAAWDSYIELCKQGARDFYSKSLPKVGIKVPFEAGCLDETVEVIGKKLGV